MRITGQLPEDSILAKNVLTWITYARLPLTTAELCHALAVHPGQENLDPDNVPDAEDLVSVCAGLVAVDEESNIIRLVHYTAQEYFERMIDEWNPRAQLDLASTCLTYLSFSTFKSGSCPTDETFEQRLMEYTFLEYAARFWGYHTRTVQQEVCNLACLFLQNEGTVSCAAQAMSSPWYYDFGYSQHYPKNMTSFHLTAHFGLLHILEELLLQPETDVVTLADMKNADGDTPLNLASACGHDNVVKALLNKGFDANAPNGRYGCALQAASFTGREHIVELLINNSADINTQAGYFGNALQAASFAGHKQVVKLLIDRSANVNAQAGHFGNALQAASAKGYEQIVQLLIDKGANVNAQSGFCGSALQAASSQGHEHIVKLLLTKGADVNAQGGFYDSAALAAAVEGHQQIVEILLSNGAEVDCSGGPHGSILNTFAFQGYTELLRAVYEQHQGTQLLRDSHGRTALHLAARGAHLDTFNYLLNLGIDPTAVDRKGASLLHFASSGGSMEILESFMNRDLTSSSDDRTWSALHWACRAGNPQTIVRLIVKGVYSTPIYTKHPGRCWSPLSIAFFHGHGLLIEQLPEYCRDWLSLGGHERYEDYTDVEPLLGSYHGDHVFCDSCFHVSNGPAQMIKRLISDRIFTGHDSVVAHVQTSTIVLCACSFWRAYIRIMYGIVLILISTKGQIKRLKNREFTIKSDFPGFKPNPIQSANYSLIPKLITSKFN